jgi:hypothetical protein
MTTLFGENIHNIAIEGNFDDCQEMVKASFADQSFLKGTRLVAVNSINWARIMAQIVYYFHAALQLGGPARSVSFSVPTGNFGDIFAGYLARQSVRQGNPARDPVAVDGHHGLVELRTSAVRPARSQRRGDCRFDGQLQAGRWFQRRTRTLDRSPQAV